MGSHISGSRISALPVVTAWLGSELSYLEKLCLTAMVSVGHKTILYCYGDIHDVPHGVEVRQASEIMGSEKFSQYRNGSYALGSDLFRYNLLSRFPCIWVDTDMLLLRPISQDSDYIFGWEDDRYINTAILSIPGNSPMLADIHSLISDSPFFAPWWDKELTERQEKAVSEGSALRLADLPWATTGPKLVTYLACRHQVTCHACSPDVFYPVHWRDYHLPFEAGDPAASMLTDNTVGIHFWNHMLGSLKVKPAPDSFVARQCRLHGIDIPAYGKGNE